MVHLACAFIQRQRFAPLERSPRSGLPRSTPGCAESPQRARTAIPLPACKLPAGGPAPPPPEIFL
jgi:hypothetical protein